MTGKENEKAFLKFFTFLCPSLLAWFGLGMPVGRTELGLLFAGIVSAIMSFANEFLNVKGKKKKKASSSST